MTTLSQRVREVRLRLLELRNQELDWFHQQQEREMNFMIQFKYRLIIGMIVAAVLIAILTGCAEMQIAAISGKALYNASPFSETSIQGKRQDICWATYWYKTPTGGYKPYSEDLTPFYCCTGTKDGKECVGVKRTDQFAQEEDK